MSAARGVPSGEIITYFAKPEFLPFMESISNIGATNQERANLGLVQILNMESGEAKSVNGRIGFEFAPSSFFGFGVSLNSLNWSVENVAYRNTSEYITDLMFFPMMSGGFFGSSTVCIMPFFPGMCSNTPPGQVEYLGLTSGAIQFEKIQTVDFDFNFHFLNATRFDLYLRLTAGLGKAGIASVTKGGAALSLRFFPSSSGLYFETAGGVDSYSLKASDSGSSVAGSTSFANQYVSLGLGFRFR